MRSAAGGADVPSPGAAPGGAVRRPSPRARAAAVRGAAGCGAAPCARARAAVRRTRPGAAAVRRPAAAAQACVRNLRITGLCPVSPGACWFNHCWSLSPSKRIPHLA